MNSVDRENFPLLRPIPWLSGLEENIDRSSWFGRNRHAALRAIIMASDDLRFNRTVAASMLSEAWDSELFKEEWQHAGADDLDRLQMITFLQYWLTFTGMMTVEQVREIQSLSERGLRWQVSQKYSELTKIKYKPETPPPVEDGKVRGLFSGTFAPPTFMHLSIAANYHQYCDELVIAVDSDKLAQARKGPGRHRFAFADKRDVWRSFPHIVDHVVEVPEAIYENGQYNDEVIANFYKSLGIGIVFFGSSEPGQEQRLRQIQLAGARAYADDVYLARFSASDLIAKRDAGDVAAHLGR